MVDGNEYTNIYEGDAYWGNTISDVLTGKLTKDGEIYRLITGL